MQARTDPLGVLEPLGVAGGMARDEETETDALREKAKMTSAFERRTLARW